MIILPTTQVPSSKFRCTLDQQVYTFELAWNMRAGWFLSMTDSSGVVIFGPKRLVADWDLLWTSVAPSRPRGELLCMDSTGQHADPRFEDMGTRHSLVYFTADEVAELQNG